MSAFGGGGGFPNAVTNTNASSSAFGQGSVFGNQPQISAFSSIIPTTTASAFSAFPSNPINNAAGSAFGFGSANQSNSSSFLPDREAIPRIKSSLPTPFTPERYFLLFSAFFSLDIKLIFQKSGRKTRNFPLDLQKRLHLSILLRLLLFLMLLLSLPHRF